MKNRCLDLYFLPSRSHLNKLGRNSMNITQEKTSNVTLKKTNALPEEIQRAEREPSNAAARRLLFLSHATPEDSPFAKWLATQLAVSGYEVWCDVTQLLGGERFWRDIAEAIDAYAFRFLFVSTQQSNTKAGTLRELNLAAEAQQKHGLKDFIVPLKLDGLPFTSTHEIIRDLNFIRFEDNWAEGLAQLLAFLDREGALKSSTSGPNSVSDWYRRTLDKRRQLVLSDNKHFSNWFRIQLPGRVRFHHFDGPLHKLPDLASGLTRPHRVHGSHIVTFETPAEVKSRLMGAAIFSAVREKETLAFIQEGDVELDVRRSEANNIVNDLVRQAWDGAMMNAGLQHCTMANGFAAWFFKEGQLHKNKAFYRSSVRGNRTFRQLVGRKSRRLSDGTKVPDGFWHYAVSAPVQLTPFPRLLLRHHVIFTDDGETPWDSAERMHRARRRVCKRWWNPEWRDRLFAFCAVIARGRSELNLPVNDEESIRVSMTPLIYISPWNYIEDLTNAPDETTDIELIEDAEHEDDDDDDQDEGQL
jgi:hypothetical protein